MYVTNTIQITLTIFVEYHEIAIICHTKFTNNRKTPWRIGTFELKLKIGSRRGQIGPYWPIKANGTKAKWGQPGLIRQRVPNRAKRGKTRPKCFELKVVRQKLAELWGFCYFLEYHRPSLKALCLILYLYLFIWLYFEPWL